MQEINYNDEKVFFNAGDIVTLKQDIPNKPEMIVVKKETSLFKHDSKKEDKRPILIGIRCRWFTKDGIMQEAVFNTKDIQIVKN